MKKFKKFYRESSGMSVFAKVSTLFLSINILFITMLGFWFIRDSSQTILNNKIKVQRKAVENLKEFIVNKYETIERMLYNINSSTGIGGQLEQIQKSYKENVSNEMIQSQYILTSRITQYIEFLGASDTDIKDYIVIDNEGRTYYYNKDRRLVTKYDFSKDKLIKKVKASDTLLSIQSDDPDRYLSGKSTSVVSFAGNIINLNYLPERRILGQYIINISSQAFEDAYLDEDKDVEGDFFIFNKENELVFASDSELEPEDITYIEGLTNKNQVEIKDRTYYQEQVIEDKHHLKIINLVEGKVMLKQINAYKKRVYLIILLAILINSVITLFLSKIMTKKIDILLEKMEEVTKGHFDVSIPVTSQDEIGKIYSMFNNMCKMLEENINKIYFAEIKRREAQLLALQSQINPHYLFNTLESIRVRAAIDNHFEIERMIFLLGKIFRWNSKTKAYIVLIEEELENISSYLELQCLRLEDRLEVDIDVDEDILELGIPKLILQPIVENCIMHGILPLDRVGELTIRGHLENHKVSIRISDNGVGMDAKEYEKLKREIEHPEANNQDHYHIGFANVNQRIQLIFGKEYGLEIFSEKDKGTSIHVTFPAILKEELEEYVQSFTSR